MRSISARLNQSGVVLLLIAILLAGLALVGFAVNLSKSKRDQLSRVTVGQAAQTDLDKALLAFATVNKRLPCPAAATDSQGLEGATAPYTTCTAADGVLPWGTLGLPADAALNRFGRKISYRVFAGTTGFTQVDGVNALDCNTSTLLVTSQVPINASGQCTNGANLNSTRSVEFSVGKGLTVNDAGVVVPNVAYVLIDHGATGLGSYGSDHTATRQTLPNAAGKEYINTTAPVDGVYWRLTDTTQTTDSGAANFFDDVVSYMTLSDLLQRARMDARDWGWVTAAMAFTTSPATTPPSISVNATSPTVPKVATLTITLTNTATSVATLASALVTALPTGLVVAATPSATSTCNGSFTPTAGDASLTVPKDTTIPAATVAGIVKTNGSCDLSVSVTSAVTTSPNSSFTPVIAQGSMLCATSTPNTSSYLCTNKGYNLAPASATLNATLTAPALSSISPSTITPSASATTLTLSGTFFISGATVTFTNVGTGASSTVLATYVSASSLTTSFTPGTSNSNWTVRVTNPDGQVSGNVSLSVNGPPVLSSVSPNSVTVSGGSTSFTLAGTNFVSGATVTFTNGSGTATTVTPTFVSTSSLTTSFALGTSTQTWTVRVTNPDAQQSSGLSITAVKPSSVGQALNAASLNSAGITTSGNCVTTTGPITVNSITITPTATAFSPARVAATASGLGVANSSCASGTSLTNTNGETLRFQPPYPYRYLGLRLTGLNTVGGSAERATVTFYNSGGATINSVTLNACSTSNAEANYYLTASADYTSFAITAITRANNVSNSTTFVRSVAFCANAPASACSPSGATASFNCP